MCLLHREKGVVVMGKTKLPVRYLKEHLLLAHNGDIWAYYHVEPKVITQNNPRAIREQKEVMANLYSLLAPYQDIELSVTPYQLNLKEKFEELKPEFDEETKEVGSYYMAESCRILEAEGNVYKPSFMLGVKVNTTEVSDSFLEVFQTVLDRVLDNLLDWFDFEIEDIERYFREKELVVKELDHLLHSYSIRPLRQKEMVYANRLQYIRGMKHEIEEESHWIDLEDIQSGVIRPDKNRIGILKIEDELGESYQSILPVGTLPANMTNIDLFQFAQNCNFPVAFRLKVHYAEVRNHTGLSLKVGWLKNRFKEEHRTKEQYGEEVSDRFLNIRFLANHMEKRMEEKESIVEWLGCFLVIGRTPDEVRQRSLAIIKALDRFATISRAKYDQVRLFYRLLMGESLEGQTHWRQRTTIEALAELAFGTTTELGMETGYYIGRQDVLGMNGSRGEKTELDEYIYASNKFVFLNPQAIAEGIRGAMFDSPHIAVTGKSGKGKTFLVGLLFLYSSFLKVQSLFIDPKGEKRRWLQKVINNPYYQANYPLFVEHLKSFRYVSLNAKEEKNYGVLDPLVYLEDSEAKQVAQDMINELSPLGENHLLKGGVLKGIEVVLRRRSEGEQVGLLHVVEWLKENPDKKIKEYGDFLYLTINQSILRLGFSYGENKGLDFKDKTIILEIQDLSLPKDTVSPESYTDSDRKSLCLMISLGRFCEMFGKRDVEQKTAVYFTEAWVFNKSVSGRAIISAMARVGRSQMNQLVLDTQYISDLGDSEENEKGNFGVVFAFDEESEREKILKHIGLEVTDQNLNEMRRMIKGQCFMRDIYGRVGKLNVHCPFEEIAEALRTTTKTNNSLAEEKFSFA